MGSTNEQLGVMRIQEALKRAESLGLDLVEVAANANPPVCRIVDFGKYRYEMAKLEKDRRHATSKLKEIKFRVNIDEHDYITKLRHGENFLDKGNKVRVQLQFRGRENAHKELGDQLMQRVIEDMATMAQVEMRPRHQGRGITMVLAPLPAAKRKRRFATSHDLPPLEEEPDDHEDHDDHEDDHVDSNEHGDQDDHDDAVVDPEPPTGTGDGVELLETGESAADASEEQVEQAEQVEPDPAPTNEANDEAPQDGATAPEVGQSDASPSRV